MARRKALAKKESSNLAPAEPEHAEGPGWGQICRHGARDNGEETKDRPQDGKLSASQRVKSAHSRSTAGDGVKQISGIDEANLDAILCVYGALPSQDSERGRVDEATPRTILALVLPAMLTSARILHLLAHGGVKGLLEAGYHTLEQMKQRT